MAAAIESMFYKGETPWHGLGNRVIEALTVEQAIKQAGLDWKVRTQPIYLADGRQLKGGQAIIRETDNTELGVVGPRYVPLQNHEAFKPFDPLVEAGDIELETAGSLCDGKKIWVLARLTGGDTRIIGDDVIRKFMLLSNSHDGTTAIRFGFTGVRVVCANTLAMAHNDAESKLIRIKHSSKAVANLEALRDVMNLANQSFEATAEQYRQLATKQINQKDLERYVTISLGYNADKPDDLSNRATDQIAKVVSLFESGAGQDLPGVKGTVWAAYNAVTDFLSHEAGQNANNRYNSLWFGANALVNSKALDEALKLAA